MPHLATTHDRFRAPTPQLVAAARRAVLLAAVALLLTAGPAAAAGDAAATPRTPDPQLFPLPEKLRANVDFWTTVYSTYDNDRVLLHDERYLSVIYAVIDFHELAAGGLSEGRQRTVRRQQIRKAEEKYRSILRDLAAGRTSKSYPADQARVERLFAGVPGKRSKYTAAAGRLRTQTCLANRFAEAIERSGLYLPTMEEIFRHKGLPVELTRMPFVESLFQWNARSSAAAAGIWQFVSSTARHYLDMQLEADERYDPLRATEAAADLLAKNYESLKSWPLAITAYNHGRAGMSRAVRRLGTRDLGEISERYRSRTFGFASRNFYSEFLAAATVYRDRRKHFPTTAPRPPLQFEEFAPTHYVAVRELAKAASVEATVLREMNPALSREVWAGHLYLPKGYRLRVPAGQAAAFQEAFDALPASRKSTHQVGFRYKVRRGDTLSTIAGKFGTRVGSLQRANNLSSPHRIRVGQRLLIPPRPGGAVAVASLQSTPGIHVVQRGENLSRIAARYGTDVRALMSANNLASADLIAVGQRLTVPGGRASQTTHVVRSGETLAAIARRYGTTVRAIQSANRIRSHIIHPAQVLIIP